MRKSNSWIIKIAVISFFIAIAFGLISDQIMSNINVFFAALVLVVIVFIGVFSDTIGISVTMGTEKQFHSMAAKKIKGAKHSVKLIRNADMVSNFCNDVIGDVAGIISGASTVYIVKSILSLNIPFFTQTLISTVISAFVASMTIGGKALGKVIALNYHQSIIFVLGKILFYVEHKFHIKIIK